MGYQFYETDIYLILFSVTNRESFNNVLKKWNTEINEFCPKTPKVLIGTQTDARRSDGKNAIRTSEGIEMAKKIGACAYFELNSRYKCGIDKPLEFAAKLAAFKLKPEKQEQQKSEKCLIQ